MASGTESMTKSENMMLSTALASAVSCVEFLGDSIPPVKRMYVGRDKQMQDYYEAITNLQQAIPKAKEMVTKTETALSKAQKALENRRKEHALVMESFSLKEMSFSVMESTDGKDEKVKAKLALELERLRKELENSESKRREMGLQVLREEGAAEQARCILRTENDELTAKQEQLRNCMNSVVKDFMVGACASYDAALEADLKAESEQTISRVPITVRVCTDLACFNRALQYSKVLPGKSTEEILVQATGDEKEKVSGFLYRRSVQAKTADAPLPEGWKAAVDLKSGCEYYWPKSDRSAVSWERPTSPRSAKRGQDANEKDVQALQSLVAELKKLAGWKDAWRAMEDREKQFAQRRATKGRKGLKAKLEHGYVALTGKVAETKDNTFVVLRDPHFQTSTIATAGGAITFGAVGGTFGLVSGVVVGSAVGVVPALFTFGLSIPVGGAIGGGCGLCTGTLVGATSGGVTGFTAYKYRIQIKDGVMTVRLKVEDLLKGANTKANKTLEGANGAVTLRLHKFRANVGTLANKGKTNSIVAFDLAKTKASNAYAFATTTKVGVTSASAAAGAVVGGTGGGACGTVVGAAVGIVPAIFTFGLSIPAGALIGWCAGTAIGGSAGAVGGGLVGYTGFTHGKAISDGVKSSVNKATSKAENLKSKATAKASQAGESVKSIVNKAENLKVKATTKASQAGESVKSIVKAHTGGSWVEREISE